MTALPEVSRHATVVERMISTSAVVMRLTLGQEAERMFLIAVARFTIALLVNRFGVVERAELFQTRRAG